jgi:hypothetical protein
LNCGEANYRKCGSVVGTAGRFQKDVFGSAVKYPPIALQKRGGQVSVGGPGKKDR